MIKKIKSYFLSDYETEPFHIRKKMEALLLFNIVVFLFYIPVILQGFFYWQKSPVPIAANFLVPVAMVLSVIFIRKHRPVAAVNAVFLTFITIFLSTTFGILYQKPAFAEIGGRELLPFVESAVSETTLILIFELLVFSLFSQRKYQIIGAIILSCAIFLSDFFILTYHLEQTNVEIIRGFPDFHLVFLILSCIMAYIIFTVSNSLIRIAAKTLDEAKEFNQKIIDESPYGFLLTNVKGTITYASPKALELFGFELSEIILGRNFLEFFPLAEQIKIKNIYAKLIKNGAQEETEFKAINKQEEEFIADFRMAALFDAWGNPKGIISIGQDITDRKHAEDKMRRAKEEAEAATRSKSEFLANMSHEIRTPMNAIIGMTQLALKQQAGPKLREYLNIIDNSSKSLLGLINDILDFSKIEAGKLDIEKTEFYLADLLEQLSDMFRSKAADKNVELVVSAEKGVPSALSGDPLRLSQILTNLLSNAVKFTERGEIVLRVKTLDVNQYQARLLFVVRDTGIGVPEEKVPFLFDSFTQLDGSTSRKFGGTGLGLAICKSLAELMDGELWVESQIGKGSTFYFSGVFERQPASKEKEHIIPENIAGTRVLVVEDNESSRIMITEMLEKICCESVAIADGNECVPALVSAQQKEDPFQIVLLDWRMPAPDGIEVARLIRREEIIAETPIVLMTAFGSSKEIEEVGRGLIDAFLLKPIKQSSLFDTIIGLFAYGEGGGYLSEGLISRESIGREAVRGSRLLLVEDNYINQQVALEILTSAGIEVVVANNGIEGVEAVEHDHFDAVLMDVQMPEMDGFEATKLIRKKERFKQLPIIAMTANAMKGDREKCIAAGMNDYISKPIDTTQLFTCLRAWAKTPGKAPVRQDLFEKRQETSEERQVRLPENLPGINLCECINRLGGNRSLIAILLKDFLAKNKNSIKDIQKCLNTEDFKTAERLAHTLKGVSGNIGAEKLFENAKELNGAIRKQNTQQLPALLDATEEALTEVLQGLEKELGGEERDRQEQESSNGRDGEGLEGNGIAPLIVTLQQALNRNDFEAEKIFTRIKSQLIDAGCRREAEDIAEYLDNFDFKAASEIIDEVVTKLDLNL